MMKKGCVCSQSELLYTLSGQSILKQILKKKKKENKKDHKYRQCNAKTILQYKIWYFSFFWKLTWPDPSLRTSAAGWDVGDLLASPLLNHACSESIRSYRLTAQNKVKKKILCSAQTGKSLLSVWTCCTYLGLLSLPGWCSPGSSTGGIPHGNTLSAAQTPHRYRLHKSYSRHTFWLLDARCLVSGTVALENHKDIRF